MIKIGNIKIKGKYVLAPIADVTDVAFRILCKKYGASLVFTEMINANALFRKNKATLRLAKVVDEERPVGVQLFGTKLEHFKKAVELVDGDIIDLNLGCPATKVLRQGSGGALLIRPKKIKDIVETLVSSANKPVTVKMRSGLKQVNALQIAKVVEDAGASALTLHPRTVVQGYSGKADWSLIKKVKDSVSIPVIGNGDVRSLDDGEKMIKETGCDLVMIGRAAMSDPKIFSRRKEADCKEKIDLIFEYYDLTKKYNVFDFSRFKRRAMDITKGVKNSAKLRYKLSRTKNVNEIRKLLSINQ